MDHDDLVQEMKHVELLPVGERIQLARKRRRAQLAKYREWALREDFSQSEGPAEEKSRKKIKFSAEVELAEAVTKGNLQELDALLEGGMDPNTRNYEGMTALHQCCIEGRIEMARLLIQKGADVNARDADKWTPLHAAATCGHKDLVGLLVRTGADLLASNSDEDMPFEITEDDDTLMFLEKEMAYQGITDRMVIEKRQAGYTRLKRDIFSLLRDGASLDVPVTGDGASLLHVAVANFHNDLVKVLLKHGASDETEDDEGWRPIHVAAYWGNDEAVKLLVKKRLTDVTVKTNTGETPFDLCEDPDLKLYFMELMQGRKRSISLLNLSPKNISGKSPKRWSTTGVPHSDHWLHRRGSVEEVSVANPLFNPEANVRSSMKRNSFRDAKKYAPNIKVQNTDRGREPILEELKEQENDTEHKKLSLIMDIYQISSDTNTCEKNEKYPKEKPENENYPKENPENENYPKENEGEKEKPKTESYQNQKTSGESTPVPNTSSFVYPPTKRTRTTENKNPKVKDTELVSEKEDPEDFSGDKTNKQIKVRKKVSNETESSTTINQSNSTSNLPTESNPTNSHRTDDKSYTQTFQESPTVPQTENNTNNSTLSKTISNSVVDQTPGNTTSNLSSPDVEKSDHPTLSPKTSSKSPPKHSLSSLKQKRALEREQNLHTKKFSEIETTSSQTIPALPPSPTRIRYKFKEPKPRMEVERHKDIFIKRKQCLLM